MKNKYFYGVIPLILFAVFSVSVLSCLLTGAMIYKGVSKRDDAAFTMRTAAQYICVKVRQTELQSEIRIEEFEGVCSIVLPAQYGDDRYITRLYCYDGSLWELFCPEGTEMKLKDGEKVLSLSGFEAETDGGIITIRLMDKDGEVSTLELYQRGNEGDVYEE